VTAFRFTSIRVFGPAPVRLALVATLNRLSSGQPDRGNPYRSSMHRARERQPYWNCCRPPAASPLGEGVLVPGEGIPPGSNDVGG